MTTGVRTDQPLDPETAEAPTVTVEPLTGRIGAEIVGLDLSADLSDGLIAAVRQALLSHRVVFFRDQELDMAGQTALAERFGPLTIGHPTLPGPDAFPQVVEFDALAGARADHWHTDVTFADRPPTFSVLRAVTIPRYGGDTIWANTVAAYQDLPDSLQHFVDGLRAIHTNTYDYANPRQAADPARRRHLEVFTATVFETEHPVVRIHPETGERALLLGGFAHRLVGLSADESRSLLHLLADRITRPENTVRWRWRAGDVAIWDNRATQHYAVNDYGDVPRTVQRVTVAGAIPLGIDGQPSRALIGDATSYSVIGAA
jgi:alpha-ketoglutarate-dependent taurine dioxygenase